MSKVTRRSFLEKAGVTLAAGSMPIETQAVGGAGAGKGRETGKLADVEDPTRKGIARSVVEWSYSSNTAYADPFNELELDVVFTDPEGHEHKVPAFWAGEQTWRIRYTPMAGGRYTYRTVASDGGDLDGRHGVLEVAAYQGDNPLRKHGPVRVASDKRHFEHADGTPFFWLGDTWWMGLCNRMRWPEDFQELAADRVKKGFTVIQIIAGLYPDMPPFDPRGANEAGFPWEADYARINPAYFDAADLRIRYLVESGLTPCIVACWGYFLPIMGIPKIKKHWRYLIARWGAYPVIWCLAGEGTMPFYLSKTPKEDAAAQKQGWTEVAKYVRSIDPYHHPVTIHPGDSARNTVEDESVLDFDMLQTGHGDRTSIPNTENLITGSLARTPKMPVLAGEVCYEGILEASRQEIQRFMFWTCILNGAGGHTYGANGIWQVNTREQPYGPSPHGRDWGDVPWDVAAHLPGSQHIGIGKGLLSQYPWWRFEPHPEWVEPHWSRDNYELPYAAGIPGEVRVIFIPPAWDPPKLKGLEPGVSYRAFYFDPKSGSRNDIGDVAADSTGTWPAPITPLSPIGFWWWRRSVDAGGSPTHVKRGQVRIRRRVFMELAGASALSWGVPTASLKASSPQNSQASPSPSALVELNNLPFLHGREYFILRSGRAQLIFQVDRADLGPAFTHMLFDVENATQSARKERAFNFDPEQGLAASALRVELGGFAFTAFGEQTEARWVNLDGVPAVEAKWWAGGVKVTERILALAGAGEFLETIQLDGSALAGDDSVNIKLFLPRGERRAQGRALLQDGGKYACAICVLGESPVRAAASEGSVTIGPLAVGPGKQASVEILRLFQIPSGGVDALAAECLAITTEIAPRRQSTKATWDLSSSVATDDSTLRGIFNKARFGLPGMIADNGTMNAGIFQYGRQWVRDTSNSALGALHAGHFELARAALVRVLTDLVSDQGATAIASQYDQPDQEELDQMGELLHVLKSYRDWTGDESLVRDHRKKLLALIERPLQPIFRDDTGMVHNRREFWERSFDDAYELIYQAYLVQGLWDAVELAPLLGAEDRVERWRHEANRTHEAILTHPSRALVSDGHLIKRRNVNGEVADLFPTGLGESPDVPFRSEKNNRLNPDASVALAIALGVIDPRSLLARKTLDDLEQLWNQRWFGGGYERYNSSSQQDTPGPWPFASCFMLRALHDARLYERSRRVLEWLNSVQGGNAGFWFEEIPVLRSNTKFCGIIPWTSGEIALFAVRHVLGIRFEGARVVIRPALFPDSPPVSADLRFRKGRLRLKIDGSGQIKHADLNGIKLARRADGSIILPEDFSSGTVTIRTSRSSGEKGTV